MAKEEIEQTLNKEESRTVSEVEPKMKTEN